MAAEVLNGGDIMTLPVRLVSDSEPVYSQINMDKFGLELPEGYLGIRERNE
jgi:hypothetical protein